MSTPASPKAVLFDWDNTLVDTWPVIHQALHATYEEFGLTPWTLEEVKARVRKSMRDSFPEIFGPDWQQAASRYQHHYRSRHLDMLKPLPGAEAMLLALRERGLLLGVVSNKKGGNLRTEITHLGWKPLFEGIVGSDDAARDKPYPDPVHLALEMLDLPLGPDIWFVGDSDIDLDCAARTGMTAVLYGDYVLDKPEFTPTHWMGFPYAHFAKDHGELERLIHGQTTNS
jgi:phosphoglycolate phosphatase